MPAEFRFDASRNILRGTMTSPLTLDDIERVVRAMVESREFPPDTPAVWDLSGVDFRTMDKAFVERVINTRKQFVQRDNVRIALIAPDDLGYGMCRMYEFLSADLAHKIMVFRTLEEGEKWLIKGDPEPRI